MEKYEKAFICAIASTILTLVLLVIFVTFANLYAERKCLQSGFPKHHVTYALEVYCSTLDGDVTVRLEKQ